MIRLFLGTIVYIPKCFWLFMRWCLRDEDYLKKTYSTRIPLEKISEKIGRTVRSIQRKAAEMGVSRPRKSFSVEKLRIRAKRANDKFYERSSKAIYARKNERRKELKLELIGMKGRKCETCGYNKCVAALEFHHRGKNKDSDLSSMIKNGSRQKALKEVERCMLLCANCHRELHNKG